MKRARLVSFCGSEREDNSFPQSSASTHSLGDTGQTPLYEATLGNNYEVVKLLLECGASANVCDNYGKTPLHAAAEMGWDMKILNLLLSYEADPNVQDLDGNTPLHLACREVEDKSVFVLLRHNADINIVNSQNETPFDIATEALEVITGEGEFAEKIIEYFIQYIVYMHSKDVKVSPKTMEIIKNRKDMFDVYNRSISKLNYEKTVKIGGTCITNYDFIVKNSYISADYVRNPHIRNELDKMVRNSNSSFQLYRVLLFDRYKEVIYRSDLLEKAHKVLCSNIEPFSKLPFECVEYILKFFKSLELKIIIEIK